MAEEEKGSIAFFTTYRPPVALDIYSCPLLLTPTQSDELHISDELHMTDGMSYNYNGHAIPPAALKTMIKRPTWPYIGTEEDVDLGRLSGMVFVSERQDGLETLHIALYLNDDNPKVEVFNFADVFGTFDGVRMEDNGCIAGDNLVYVSTMETKDATFDRRQPWTVVYKTNLQTGKTDRLTPSCLFLIFACMILIVQADLSPSVSPSGKQIAVASFQKRGGWNGEREQLKTDIFVMNVEKPFNRKLVVNNGGWPTWGSDDVIFFHRKDGNNWGVFRADISKGFTSDTSRVTPVGIDAVTPAAIDAHTVAVATLREKINLMKFCEIHKQEHHRHIEIFSTSGITELKITENIRQKADHFNPFVIVDIFGRKRIGYNRCKDTLPKTGDYVPQEFDQIKSPQDVGLFRVSGVFPTFSSDGSKLAFVDNDFTNVWLADSKGLRIVYRMHDGKVFCPVWNQNPEKDILYVCSGQSFKADAEVHICSIRNVSKGGQRRERLTIEFNNAFPSTNPKGTKLVFRSTRDHQGQDKYKNLYIMQDAKVGEYEEGEITRLTEGECIDTHCKWSPMGDWVVFSSNRDMPKDVRKGAEDLDSGFFAIFLVKVADPSVLVRVLASGNDIAGHVTHPFFSPDGKSVVVTGDLAAVSADPMSLPLYLHSARPYGDIFTVDIDLDDIHKCTNVSKFHRITHSRFENATGTWTKFSTKHPSAEWNKLINKRNSTLKINKKQILTASAVSGSVGLVFFFPYAAVAMLGLIVFAAMFRSMFKIKR